MSNHFYLLASRRNERDYLKEIIDPRNPAYKYTFQYWDTVHWNLKSITDPKNNVTQLLYDDPPNPPGKGQLTRFTDARGYTTTFLYNNHGDLETATGPAIGSPPYALTTTLDMTT